MGASVNLVYQNNMKKLTKQTNDYQKTSKSCIIIKSYTSQMLFFNMKGGSNSKSSRNAS